MNRVRCLKAITAAAALEEGVITPVTLCIVSPSLAGHTTAGAEADMEQRILPIRYITRATLFLLTRTEP